MEDREEKESLQKELFTEFSSGPKKVNRFSWFKKPISFRPLVFVFSYEKFIFLIIGLLIILTIVFCLGVEQGKRIASLAKVNTTIVAPVTVATPMVSASIPDRFNIQLATFKEKSQAEKEVSILKNKGYKAFLASSGKYYVVSIGTFSTKEQAGIVLAKVKSVYKDAYIKKNK